MAPSLMDLMAIHRGSRSFSDDLAVLSHVGGPCDTGIELVDLDKAKPALSQASTASTAATATPSSSANLQVAADGLSSCSTWSHSRGRSFQSDYSLFETVVLGTGISGNVNQAMCRCTGRSVAVKRFEKAKLSDAQLANMRSETEIHSEVDHPFIARLERVYDAEPELILVLEKLSGGEVFNCLARLRRFSEVQAAKVLQHTLQALCYLHDKGIIHRDVKLENLVFCRHDSWDVKLIDFGYATRWTDGDVALQQRCGTLMYVAPEVLGGSHTSKCDMWSVGVAAYMMLTGSHMYHGTDADVQRKALAGKPDFSSDFQRLSAPCRDFVSSLLRKSPEQRLSAHEALSHPWLSSSH